MKFAENEIDRIKARINAEIDGMIQVLPACRECEHCHNSRYITHRVKSDEIDMQVCVQCAQAAMRLQGYGREGRITVERING